MTTYEFFRNQYLTAVESGCGTTKVITINPEIPKGSFKWVKVASEWFFGGAWDYEFSKSKVTDIAEMIQAKSLKKNEYSSWRARNLGQTSKYTLTAKGLKELYKMYEQW